MATSVRRRFSRLFPGRHIMRRRSRVPAGRGRRGGRLVSGAEGTSASDSGVAVVIFFVIVVITNNGDAGSCGRSGRGGVTMVVMMTVPRCGGFVFASAAVGRRRRRFLMSLSVVTVVISRLN